MQFEAFKLRSVIFENKFKIDGAVHYLNLTLILGLF